MAPPLLRGKHVIVMGMGKSGLAAVQLLVEQGVRVTVEEGKSLEQLGSLPEALRHPFVTVRLAQPDDPKLFASADLLVVSPGVPMSLPPLQRARASGKPVWGEVELASRFLEPGAPVVGITGTNGKSTTTALCGELFAQAGLRPFVGGNLGTPLSEAVTSTSAPKPGAYVIELSSFQLEGLESLRINAAALLNLTPDHLDRYEDHAAYGAAKARIFQSQLEGDVAVVNADDEGVRLLARSAKVPVYGFSLQEQVYRPAEGFAGLASPTLTGFQFNFGPRPGFTVQNRALRGAHNLQNAMAAALLAWLQNVPQEAIQRGLDAYPGLAHRLESVRTLDGVEWVNDSKATNVDSTLVALNAFQGGRVWLIAGGKGKGAPYAPLEEAGKGCLAGILTIGQDADTISAELGASFGVHPCGTLEAAVTRARELAREGEVVLLSPACASYDQFRNFEDRGETFKRLVMALSS